MLKPVVTLDADMFAGVVVERLAILGFWDRLDHPVVQARLQYLARRLKRDDIDSLAKALARDPAQYGAAIRRQWGARILWYPKELQEVLALCLGAPPGQALIDVLNLHESDAVPTITHRGGETALSTGVLMDQGTPIGVSFAAGSSATRPWEAAVGTGPGTGGADTALRSATRSAVKQAEPEAEEGVWPRIDAPEFAPALKPFEVIVGFGARKQAGVSGGQVTLDTAAKTIDLQVELAAGPGVQAIDGWSRTMRVDMNDILSAQVSFQLMGSEPAHPRNPYLTMLEVRYVLDGTVCGAASRPLGILHSVDIGRPSTAGPGEAWKDIARNATPVSFKADEHAPDLTIEISKPDHNASSGHYMCQIYSPHSLVTSRGPFPMDLGQDAKTYAKALVDEVRLFTRSELLANMLESNGRGVADRLPRAVFQALREVDAKVKPAVPTVLIVSAEPYVPWELAWIDPPLADKLPGFLGAQAVVGRWLRDGDPPAAPSADMPAQRPATHPNASLTVRNMAVMTAWYQAQSGMRRLPKAEAEAKAIANGWQGVLMAASAGSIRDLLAAKLMGGVEAVHFAGHGDFDPTKPDGAALFLEDGTPLHSKLFRSAKYGGERQPLMFLNACMLGIGGELLGDMGGFPGNSLRGGFGGVIGALWEVNDTVAHDVALEFWSRALPPHPERGEPVGAILRDMRAKFLPDDPAPVSTYLAYVYYGHPNLTLARASP